MIRKIPILSYDKENIEKWLSQPLLKNQWNKTETNYEKKSKAIMKKITKIKKLFSSAPYISLYSASFLLVTPEKQTGNLPQQECEKESIFCVQRLTKNDALWRLGNDNPARRFL